jgi:hypothetical protein
MKIEFDIFNREFFRTLTCSLKFQKKAQVSIIYMKNIVFLLSSCTMDKGKQITVIIINVVLGSMLLTDHSDTNLIQNIKFKKNNNNKNH